VKHLRFLVSAALAPIRSPLAPIRRNEWADCVKGFAKIATVFGHVAVVEAVGAVRL
jgi:hypothetical protein